MDSYLVIFLMGLAIGVALGIIGTLAVTSDEDEVPPKLRFDS